MIQMNILMNDSNEYIDALIDAHIDTLAPWFDADTICRYVV
jgi:hypothetical protein